MAWSRLILGLAVLPIGLVPDISSAQEAATFWHPPPPVRSTMNQNATCVGGREVRLTLEETAEPQVLLTHYSVAGETMPRSTLDAWNAHLRGLRWVRQLFLQCDERREAIEVEGFVSNGAGDYRSRRMYFIIDRLRPSLSYEVTAP